MPNAARPCTHPALELLHKACAVSQRAVRRAVRAQAYFLPSARALDLPSAPLLPRAPGEPSRLAMAGQLPPDLIRAVLQALFPPEPLPLMEVAHRWHAVYLIHPAWRQVLLDAQVPIKVRRVLTLVAFRHAQCACHATKPCRSSNATTAPAPAPPPRQVAVRALPPLPAGSPPWLRAHAVTLHLLGRGRAQILENEDRYYAGIAWFGWLGQGGGQEGVPLGVGPMLDLSACQQLQVREARRPSQQTCLKA